MDTEVTKRRTLHTMWLADPYRVARWIVVTGALTALTVFRDVPDFAILMVIWAVLLVAG